MRMIRLIPFLMLVLVGSIFLLPGGIEPAIAQGQNLLVNPGFEGQYSSYTPETGQEQADCPVGVCTTAQVPFGWKPWWVKERPTDVNPEFKPAERNVSGNRVHSGDRAAQYFSFWTTHKAGLRQTVSVPAGATLQFSVWGHAWLSEEDNSFVSDFAGTPNMRIGIDPTGGVSPYSTAIVWSEYKQAFDNYQHFTVTAQAQGDRVTVFTFSAPSVNPNSPEYGFKHTDIYWDEASLVATGGAAAPPPAQPVTTGGGSNQSSSPAPVAGPIIIGPAATPDAEGNIYAEVQPGDSIWSMAARNGLSLDEILALNDMTKDDVVHTGDLLLVGHAEPPAPEEEAPAEDTAAEEESAEQATPEPAAAPEENASTESIAMVEQDDGGVAICLMAFEDVNQNSVHDGGEALRPAVAFSISNGETVVSNYVTDGSSEPFCIEGLEPGDYNITRSSTPEEVMTTPGDRAVSLTEGGTLNLAFGSYESEEALAMADDSAEATGLESGAAAGDSGGDPSNTAVVVVVVGAVLLLVAVAVYLLRSRGSQAEAG